MPVKDLMSMHSAEALRRTRYEEYKAGNPDHSVVPHSGATTYMAVHDSKVKDIAKLPVYHELEGPIKTGKIDPVMLQHNHNSDTSEIIEGHHRIALAWQLGVTHLPTVSGPGSFDTQKHYNSWPGEDDDE